VGDPALPTLRCDFSVLNEHGSVGQALSSDARLNGPIERDSQQLDVILFR
jgi:hypothetical protein